MFENAQRILSRYCLNRPLLLGVSGGADSMCLLSLVLDCKDIDKNNITVFHIDHNLRETSARDKKLVEAFCTKNGIKHKVFSVDILESAKNSGNSIETEARNIRRKIFDDYCKKTGALLLLGHNQNDQAETVLMHIFRGCGVGGLRGMSECDGNIIRPLIENSKAEIYAFAKQNNIPFFEDETNQDPKYSRNFVRALLEKIEEKYPAAKENIARLSELAKQNLEIIGELINPEFISFDGGEPFGIPAAILKLEAFQTKLAPYYVSKAAKKIGQIGDLEQRHIDIIIDFAKTGKTGGRLDLPNNLTIFKERGKLEFCFKTAPNLKKIQTIPCNKTIEKGKIKIDFDSIKNAELRFRKDGDKFCPCNSKTKKLSDYLSEKGIPNRLKDHIPLLCNGGEVLVIVGIELAEKAKITEQTLNACEIVYGEN